jgi:hypothetical protein
MAFGRTQHLLSLGLCVGALLCLTRCSTETPETLPASEVGASKTEVWDRGPGGGGGKRAAHAYIWMSPDLLAQLPQSGRGWTDLEKFAQNNFIFGGPNTGRFDVTLFEKTNDADVLALAKAMVFVRTSFTWTYRQDIQRGVREIMDEWSNAAAIDCSNEQLSVARNLTSWVLAADYVGLDEPLATDFRQWLGTMIDTPLCEYSDCVRDDRSLREIMLERPNNWGTMTMAALAAVAAYRDDVNLLGEVRRVFDGWLGDRQEYADFRYGDLCWQPNPALPVGIGPPGSTIVAGACSYPMDGALPEELRRSEFCVTDSTLCDAAADCDTTTSGIQCTAIACPQNVCTSAAGQFQYNIYIHGALAGAVVCAEILSHRGYADVYGWEQDALKRAAQWLLDRQAEDPLHPWWFNGNDSFVPWILNAAYGTAFPAAHVNIVGRNMDFTDWTHQSP